MPGIEELLPRLAESGVLLGIVTGNIEAAAQIKLARGDLNRYFTFGGYGSDSRDRTELTKKAIERGGEVPASRSTRAATIAVGDTPRDVNAGHGAGIKVVGVATGNYSRRRARGRRRRLGDRGRHCPVSRPEASQTARSGPGRCRVKPFSKPLRAGRR